MEHNLSNSYAEAMDVILSNEEKLRLIRKLNDTLPDDMQLAESGVATSREAFLNAIRHAGSQLSRIAFSSGFNPWIVPQREDLPENIRIAQLKLNSVVPFEEFMVIHEKICSWYGDYTEALLNLDLEITRNKIKERNENNGC